MHPRASGLETMMLTWALERLRAETERLGRTFSLWCRYHDSATERRSILEGAGFSSLPARDLCLTRPLAIALPAAHLPTGFVLRGGVFGEELE